MPNNNQQASEVSEVFASSSKSASNSSSPDNCSPAKEESFIEALKSQVDRGNIEDIIQSQKKALERFEKTNEMLATCCTLAEKRLERARKEFSANKDQILVAREELESIFRRIATFKRALAKQHPKEYGAQLEAYKSGKEG